MTSGASTPFPSFLAGANPQPPRRRRRKPSRRPRQRRRAARQPQLRLLLPRRRSICRRSTFRRRRADCRRSFVARSPPRCRSTPRSSAPGPRTLAMAFRKRRRLIQAPFIHPTCSPPSIGPTPTRPAGPAGQASLRRNISIRRASLAARRRWARSTSLACSITRPWRRPQPRIQWCRPQRARPCRARSRLWRRPLERRWCRLGGQDSHSAIQGRVSRGSTYRNPAYGQGANRWARKLTWPFPSPISKTRSPVWETSTGRWATPITSRSSTWWRRRLGTDPTTYDTTIQTAPGILNPSLWSNTPYIDRIDLLVNKGKASALTPARWRRR